MQKFNSVHGASHKNNVHVGLYNNLYIVLLVDNRPNVCTHLDLPNDPTLAGRELHGEGFPSFTLAAR